MNQREATRIVRETYEPMCRDENEYYTRWIYECEDGGYGRLRIYLAPSTSSLSEAATMMRRQIAADTLYVMYPDAEEQVIMGGPLGIAMLDAVKKVREMDYSVRQMVAAGVRIYKDNTRKGGQR